MDAYPSEYLCHLTPPIFISGLGTDEIPDDHNRIVNNPLFQHGEVLLESLVPDLVSPIAVDIKHRFQSKSRPTVVWETLASKASRRQVNHLIHVKFRSRVSPIVFEMLRQSAGINR